MSERGRQCYALLRTLNAWTPDPPASKVRADRGFIEDKQHYVTCPDCLANDQPRGMRGCETCGGRGELFDPRPDPYKLKVTGFYASEDRERRREESRRRDRVIRQLEDDQRVRDGLEAPSDATIRLVSAWEHHTRTGSYLELERALERLRASDEVSYRVCAHVVNGTFGEPSVDPAPRVLAACELLASWMPDRVRVPVGVHVFTADELSTFAANLKERATWRGKRNPLARDRRNAAIRTFAAEGMAAPAIAARIGVHRRTVERFLARDDGKPPVGGSVRLGIEGSD